MKILLIRPQPDRETIGLQHVMICEPIELEYLCSSIGDLDHETVIVDMILERRPVEYFIRKHQPDIVCVTAYITHVRIAEDCCRAAKEIIPGCRTVVGGVHAEVVPSDFDSEHIDFVVRANPLATFRELIITMESDNDSARIEGLWQAGKPPCVKETSFSYPAPDRSKVARYRSRYYYLFHNPCALVKTSFGCPFDCAFCFCRHVTDDKYFERELDDVIAELKTIPERDVYIVDDNFLVSRSRLLKFCDRLESEKIDKKYLIYGRADFIEANEDVIERFSRLGLRAVIVGLESCSERELTLYNKKSSRETNEKAVAILSSYGVDCYGTLILGMDWNKQDFNNLYRWLRKLDLIFVNLQPFTPLPGTPMFEKFKDQLIVPRDEYEKWDLAHLVVHPSQMSISAYYWNIVKLYYRITMRPRHVWRLARKYGLRENLKLLAGSTRVTIQYLKKIFANLGRKNDT